MTATPARYDIAPDPDEKPTVQAAEDFDLAAWIDGVQPAEHAVTLYARGDLFAELDLVKARIDQARREGRDGRTLSPLQKKAKRIAEEIGGSALDVKVRGWSQDKAKAFQEPLREAGMDSDDITVEQVCAQVVSPAGFTADFYRTLLDRIGPQAHQIAAAVLAANTRVPVVSVPS